MTWPILTTTEFDEWFEAQSPATKASVLAVLRLLGERGPNLGRPHVDTIHGSSMKNLKELRVSAKARPYACSSRSTRSDKQSSSAAATRRATTDSTRG